MPDKASQVVVVGAGPAGLAAALSLGRLGMPVAVVAPPTGTAGGTGDRRTTALIGPSVDLLRNLGVWRFCAAEAAAFTATRIADDSGAIVRAPELLFRAQELGLESFGANIPNAALLGAFDAVARECSQLSRIETSVRTLHPGDSDVRVNLATGATLTARLVVAADGRTSLAPAAAGIAIRSWRYPQAAIVTSFGHARPHDGIVNELHRRTGPLTTVPLPGGRSSLVWVEEPDEARRVSALGNEAFADLLEQRLQGVLGAISDVDPRSVYPLAGATAERMAARRVALVGEAAHVVPPIGAQGLNLGLRDAAALADCVAEAQSHGHDVGAPEVLAAYQRMRGVDVAARSAAIDWLNRSLLTDFLPLDLARGAAAHLLARSSAFRRMLMRGGIGVAGPLPRLMQADAADART